MNQIVIATLATVAFAALPPGYEDESWCPEGSCLRRKPKAEDIAGPKRIFYECYNPENGEIVNEVWTGFRSDTKAPAGWKSRICTKAEASKSVESAAVDKLIGKS